MDVLSYVFVIAALLWWKRPAAADSALSENFLGAFRAGLRYTRASKELHRVLLRAAVFFLFASAVWALLPLVARQMLGGSSGFYGVLLGAVGAGAILGALLLPRLGKLDADGLVLLASVASAAVMAALVFAPPKWLAVLLLVVLGMGWITALTTFNSVAQAILPNWVRGRGLAVYLTVFNGAMAAGSLGWGLVAREIGVPYALAASAAGWSGRAAVPPRPPAGGRGRSAGIEPLARAAGRRAGGARSWPGAGAGGVPHPSGRPPRLLAAMKRLSQERLRDGAYAWGVVEHTGDAERVVEWFFVESWAEHLRQHHRVSHADADLQAEALRFHVGPDKPEVHHFLALKH